MRELLHAVPKAAGKHFLVWDGLDRDGNSLPAGKYTWKLLQTPGLKASYLMSVGTNFPPGKDWTTACGPGTHSAPFGVAVDATGIYVAAHTTENIETCLLKLAPDGKSRLWSALHPRAWDGALSLAADGGELYMLGHVRTTDDRIEPAKKRKQLVYAYDAATGKLARRTVSGSAVGEIPVGIDVQWDPANDDMDATDMDARGGVLVVAYQKKNALRWYKAATGKLLDTIKVPAPQGVTLGAGGVACVTTGDRVVKVSRTNRTPAPLVTGLDRPGRIDADRSSGELLVYLAGTQQIQRFSKEGKPLKTYGAKGGRKDGLYDAEARRSFAGFADLCADGAGGFYVTESAAAPRRTAHFDRDGAVLREWYGGQRWAPHAVPEGDDPNVLWVGSHYGWVMRVLADYKKKTWTVHSCWKYTDLGGGLVGDSFNEGGYFRVYKHAGKTYLVVERSPTILVVEHVRGRTLQQVIQSDAPGPRRAAAIVARLARTLVVLHGRGIIHQDLKPGNIIIDETGQPRILDFGLALLRNVWTEDRKVEGGTIAYMAPEQARGEIDTVSARSDIYSLGAVLYHLLVGHAPIHTEDRARAMSLAQRGEYDRDALAKARVPAPLRAICTRALASEPENRFATANDLALALEWFLRRRYLAWTAAVALVLVTADFAASYLRRTPPVKATEPLSIRVHRRGEWKAHFGHLVPLSATDKMKLISSVPATARLHVSLFRINGKGELFFLGDFPPDAPRPITYPEQGQVMKFQDAPPGVEMLLAVGRRAGKVELAELQQFWDQDGPLEGLPAEAVLHFDDEKVWFDPSPRDVFSLEDLPDPTELVKNRIDRLRQKFQGHFTYIEGVVFLRTQ